MITIFLLESDQGGIHILVYCNLTNKKREKTTLLSIVSKEKKKQLKKPWIFDNLYIIFYTCFYSYLLKIERVIEYHYWFLLFYYY